MCERKVCKCPLELLQLRATYGGHLAHTLWRGFYRSLWQVELATDQDLLSVRNLGAGSLAHLRRCQADRGTSSLGKASPSSNDTNVTDVQSLGQRGSGEAVVVVDMLGG